MLYLQGRQALTPDDALGAMHEHQVVAAIVLSEGRVLLCHRRPDRKWYPDVWDFPGGHVEDGERPEQALRREIFEELGVDIGTVEGDPVLRVCDTGSGFDLTIWVVADWQGTVQNCQPDEHDNIGWFGPLDLPNVEFADEHYLPLLERILAAPRHPVMHRAPRGAGASPDPRSRR
jgi:8-oxo-dGTP diphosphatase